MSIISLDSLGIGMMMMLKLISSSVSGPTLISALRYAAKAIWKTPFDVPSETDV